VATAAKIRTSAEIIEVLLTPTDISNKYIMLPFAPFNPLKVTVDVIGGTAQTQFVDYQILGLTFAWAGMGLETILSVNDKLRIVYYK
jgi:hypothetical protein